MPLISALWRQNQEVFYKLEASLIYRVSSGMAMATPRNPVSGVYERGGGGSELGESRVGLECLMRPGFAMGF